MKKSWKKRIDVSNDLDELRNTVADILHRNRYDVNEFIEMDWLDVANKLIESNPELSEMMAHAAAKRKNLK